MFSLYIHVPFCATRCVYCDFFSNTDTRYKEPYLRAIEKEMELRGEYIDDDTLETIYLGGGTPSRLSGNDLERIFNAISRRFSITEGAEITLEANPDDIRPDYLSALRDLPINRISMGIQSFRPEDLRLLNRRHDREQAIRAVELCQAHGFTNLSIDLIYGLPGQTPEAWEENLRQAIRLGTPHLSAYHLTYEEGTTLYKRLQAGQVEPVDEEVSVTLFHILTERMAEAGFQHYEISNFARPGFHARHNSAYWTGKPYLGLGPSAHSYNRTSREWNVASLPLYLRGIESGQPATERETLDLSTRYNDFIITGLRTMWGISLDKLRAEFGEALLAYCQKQAHPYIQRGLLRQENDRLALSQAGILLSDGIMSELMYIK